jgi:F-type H+-transporting ATPase subunit alpha
VGSAAQIKALKKVSSQLKLEMAQYHELQAFMQFGSELDAKTQQQLERGKRIVELLKQDANLSRPVEIQVLLLWALQKGLWDTIPVDRLAEAVTHLITVASEEFANDLVELESSKDLSESLEATFQTLWARWEKGWETH